MESSSEEEVSSDEDFSFIRPTLTKQLRNILQKYPDNGQIIKEILQNAEDAGATTVKFLYDETSHQTIFDLGKRELRGPSLYVYNDGMFTEKDWKGIRMLEDSFKEKDPLKIGRFGLGFKSIFHLTDYPSIISEARYGINSPDENLFGKGVDGKLRDFHKRPPERNAHRDRSDIYDTILNTDVGRGKCKGTLFRLPLRQSSSAVSSTIYDSNRILNLFNMFFQEGKMSLVFLQHLEKIEFYIRRQGHGRAEILRSFSINDDRLELVREARRKFIKEIEAAQSDNRPETVTQTLQMDIIEKRSHHFVSRYEEKKSSFFVSNVYACEELRKEEAGITTEAAKEEGVAPLVGVAFQIDGVSNHVFCALPLPMRNESLTGLPVHVNGSFALGPERNDLKRASPADGKVDDKKILWNEFLTNHALPVAYVNLVRYMLSFANTTEHATSVYNALPCLDDVKSDWRPLAGNMYQEVFTMKFLWTEVDRGHFTDIQSAVFMKPDETRKGMLLARDVLIKKGRKIVQSPDHVYDALGKFSKTKISTEFDPTYVRRYFKLNPSTVSIWSREQRLTVLKSLLKKAEDLTELDGVEILPTLNDSFCNVNVKSYVKKDLIYVPSQDHPSSLIPDLKRRVVNWGDDEGLYKLFYEAAKRKVCQLRLLDSSSMIRLIKKMQSSWATRSGLAFLLKQHPSAPSTWLIQFWEYITKHKVAISDTEGMLLIPLNYSRNTKNVDLARLEENSTLLYLDNPNVVNAELQEVLTGLGCTLIHDLPDCIIHKWSIMGTYIYRCKPEDLLKIFINIYKKKLKQICKEVETQCNPQMKEKLVEIFSKALQNREPDNTEREMLQSLPIFKVFRRNCHVSIATTGFIAPKNLRIIPDKQMLENSDQKKLAQKLGAKLLSIIDLVALFLIPELSRNVQMGMNSDQLIDVILGYVQTLFQEDNMENSRARVEGVVNKLSEIEFLPGRKTANALFDPTDGLALKIFKSPSCFPPPGYKKYIDILRRLGLRSAEDIKEQEILDVISQIEGTAPLDNKEQGIEQSAVLLQLFNEHPQLLPSNRSVVAQMQQRKWIEVLQERPAFYPRSLPWHPEESGEIFQSPTHIFHESNAFLVGASHPVTKRSINVLQHGQEKKPSIHDVLKQLGTVTSSYDSTEKQAFVNVLDKIYRFMSPYNMLALSCVLSSLPHWAWNGCGFVKPSQIVINSGKNFIDLKPYVFAIPDEMLYFKEMFLEQGAFAEDSYMCLVSVLQMIKAKYERESCGINPSHDRRDIKLIEEILQELCQRELDEDDIEALLLPTRSNESNLIELTPRKNCVYAKHFGLNINPSEYFDSGSSAEDRLTHQIISQAMADKFELKEFHSHVLDAEELMFEQYGQHEPLTTRLNRLLEDYRDGFAIPKELLQNADDAGATEIKFLYDERQNKDAQASLLTPDMRGFQGPALWVYNDAIFTDEDFSNLTKLHGATKKEKADKIGKFGLGFNSVYNLTDLPSLVSNESMFLLDPHTSYLGEHIKNPSQPGIKLKLRNKQAVKLYQDQWKPYDGIFDLLFNPSNSTDCFDGTLFRFPLRTKKQASHSKIKDLAYDNREMKKFICKLLEGAGRLLLFTQNVSRLSVYHLADNSNPATDMIEVFSMEKAIKVVRPLSSQNKSEEDCVNILTKAAEIVKIGKKPAKELLCHVDVRVERRLSRSARLFVNDFNSFQGKDTWLITSHIDSNDCFDFAVKSAGLNPSASVAMKLFSEDSKLRAVPLDCDADKGHVFCHVPLPITTDFPVHLNGSFAVTANRQALQEISEDDKDSDMEGPKWNRLLMKGPVAKAYLSTLEYVLNKWNGSAEEWFALWPCQTAENSNSCLSTMTRGFYSKLIGGQVRLLPMNGKQWCCWNEMVLFEEEFLEDEDIKDSIITICKILMPERKFVEMPKIVKDSISNVGFGKDVEKQSIKKQEFFKIFMANVENSHLPSTARDTITKYALLNCADDDLLRTSKCIPTMPSGALKSPSGLIDYASEAKDLFFTEEEVFPANEFQKYHLRNRLLHLGMVSEDIPMSTFKERAATVKTLAKKSHDDARIRSEMLVNLLNKKIRKSPDKISSNQLQTIPFLPVRKEPTKWHPLPWEGENVDRFLPPSELFVMKYSLLIGCHSAVVDESVETGCGPLGQELSNALQVKEQVTFKHIVAQAKQLSQVNGQLPQQAKEIFSEIYELLQKHLKDVPEDITEFLKGSPTILIDRRLVKPAFVSFELSFDARPYLYQLPEEYSTNFGALMKKIGVRREFSCEDYSSALHAMKDKFKESKLSKKNLKLCRSLLEFIKETLREESPLNEESPLDQEIYMPDSNGVLRNASKVCINSHPWIPKRDDTIYVHPVIPSKLAFSLGAKESRSDHFQKNSIGLPFGQHESLTVRLKKILDSYCVDDQIMNEMLQNADDAQASEVHFILDTRNHGCKKIFCDEWEPLQGPALLIRNNGVFRPEDLTGIQRLGEGSKTEDVFTTGKYGVGFNVVYHLTDAPSLLTSIDGEDMLCLFDPHAKYFEGATRETPGRKIVNAVENLKETYTDIHSSFLLDKLKDGPATLFRLPLRNAEMAKSSEISNKEMSVDTVKKMLESFRHKLMSSVIFLNYIEKVKISEIDEKTGAIKEIYSVKIECDATSKHQKHLLSKDLETVSKSLRENESYLEAFPCKPYTLQISDSTKLCEKWQVIQKVGSTKNVPESVRDHGFDKISCLPVGGIACCESSSKSGKSFGKIDDGSHHGRYFCLLPLTFKTNLPVNINGQFILEHESRHRLWSTKNDSFQRDWNNYLLEDCVAPCYADYIRIRAHAIKIHFKKGAINEVVSKTYPGGGVADPSNQAPESVNKGNNISGRPNTHEALATSNARQRFESKDHPHNKPPDEMSPRDKTKCFYPGELHSYFKVFPSWSEKDDEYNSALKRRLYQVLSDPEALILPVLRPRHSEIAEAVKPEWFAPTLTTAAKFFVPDFTIEEAAATSIPRDVSAVWIKKIRSILDLLLKEGMNIFNIPKHIQEAFERAEKPLAKLTPQSTREYLQMKRKLDSVSNKKLKGEKITMICNVLKFCEIQSLEELDGLPLLVTGDNMLGTFDGCNPIFVDTISDIFTSKKSVCLHYDIKSILKKAIHNYQANNVEAVEVPLKRFKIKDLVAALNEDVACNVLKVTEHVYEISYVEETLPSKAWLKTVWTFLCNECQRLCQEKEKELLEKGKKEVEKGKGKDSEREQLKAGQRTELNTQLLHPLSDWCLLPADRVDNQDATRLLRTRVLVPVKHCKSILNGYCSMYDILDKVGVLRINNTAIRRYPLVTTSFSRIDDPNEKFVGEIVASVSDPKSFLYALYMQSLKDRGCFEKISHLQRDKLLEWLNGKDIKWDEEMLQQIRSLKIFNAVNGMPYSVCDEEVIIPPDEVPSEGSEVLMRQSGVIVCKENAGLRELYHTLGFIRVNDLQLYEEYIFPSFAGMTEEEDRYKHLVYIRNRDSHKSHDCLKEKERGNEPKPCPLFEKLAEIPFVLSAGKLFRAKELFDYRNAVFLLFLPKSCFPPEKYEDDEWMLFLKKLGLVTEVTSEKYLEFAREVEESSISEKSKKKSGALVRYLFSTDGLKDDAYFMRSVAQVNYLFADAMPEMFAAVVPAFVEANSKICFRDSFCLSYYNDVARTWAVATILPSYVQDHLAYGFYFSREANYLGIKFEISPELVERNFVHVIQSEKLTHRLHMKIADDTVLIEEDKVTLKDTVLKISEATYDFLSRKRYLTRYLQNRESVLIRGTNYHMLVKPCDATLANFVDLTPYLWTVETYFGGYFDLFKSIGVTEKPSSIQLATVLEKIANELQGKCMDEKAATLAHRAVGHLGVVARDQRSIANIETLYLPSASFSKTMLQYLRKSHEVIYIDDMSKFVRLKKFEQPCLVYKSETASAEEEERDLRILVKKLPERLRPKPLSDLIKEEMIPAHTIRNGEVAESLLTSIQSREFRDSLWRLHINEGQPHDDEDSKKVLDEILTRIEIRTLDKIETSLMYKDEEIPESREEKPCFIIKENDLLVVNITEISSEEKLLLCTTIARELVNKLHAVITTTESATLIPMLLNMSPKQMMKFLDAVSIRRDTKMNNESEESFGNHTPKPGDFVPTELHWMLNNSFEEYDVGEFVAYEVEDPESHESVFIYAIVRRKIQEYEDSNHSIHNYRYEVCIGEGEMLKVEYFQIYKFIRNETGALATVMDSGDSNSTTDPLIGVTYEEAKTEIIKCLQEAKLLECDKRRLFIKRLYRKWHPDKHEDRPEFFNKVFQFLLSQIRRMENNEDLLDEEDGGRPSPASNWNDFFNTWDRETRQNNNFKQQYRSGPRPGGGSFWRGCPQWRANSNPQPHEAKRWYRQAKFDFDAAKTYRTNEYFEWQCFKCHQAAEKALKAALFAINADKSMDHNLRNLVSDLEIDGIQTLASRLEQLLGSSSKLRYPDRWPFPKVPHDHYTRNMADEAVAITSEIIDKIGEFLTQNQV